MPESRAKEVPFTNSEQVSMQGQVLYKLAALETAMSLGFQRLDEKMTRFQNDLHDNQLATNDRINRLDKEMTATFIVKRQLIEALKAEGSLAKAEVDKRLVEVETWQKIAMAKVGVMMAAIALIWLVVAPTIRAVLGINNI